MARKKGKRRSRGIVKTVFNPRQWMSYDSVRESGEEVTDLAKDLIKIRRATRKETFDEAIKRMNMSEKDIKAKMKSLLTSSWIYFGLAVGLLIYALFNLIFESFFAFIISAILSFIAVVLAYRDSFFYFQMKQRRLGCSFKEWVAFITRRG